MKKLLLALFSTALITTAFAAPAQKASLITSANQMGQDLSVEWGESGTVALQMFSANGRMIKKIKRLSIEAGSSTTIDLDGLASGVYYITVNTGRELQKLSLVK